MPWINLPNFEKWSPEKKAKWILGVTKKTGYSRMKTTLGGKSYYFKEVTA